MGELTPRYGFYLPGGGSSGLITPSETADIDKINDNFRIVDEAIGVKFVTSGTRPASPKDGEAIRETDTGRVLYWNDTTNAWESDRSAKGSGTTYIVATLAELDNISDCLIGDMAVMSTPGTGISGGLRYLAVSGTGSGTVWETISVVVADTKANLDTFIAAAALLSGTRFGILQTARVTSGAGIGDHVFTSTAGAINPRITVILQNSAGTISSVTWAAIPASPITTAITVGAGGRLARVKLQLNAICTGGNLYLGIDVSGAATVSPDDAWNGTAHVAAGGAVASVFGASYSMYTVEKLVNLNAGVNNISGFGKLGGAGGTKAVSGMILTVELL